MKTEHTPGPWMADRQKIHPVGSMWMIAETYTISGEGTTQENAEANARLIAAAPELLAACREMVANMEDSESTLDCDGNEFSDYAAAKAAIAKAEGKP